VTGIDLGHHAVKLVRLELSGVGTPRLTHWGVEEVSEPESDRPGARAEALNALLRRLGLRVRQLGRIASAVGGPDVYLRQVSMPRLTPELLRNALPYEAKKHLPLDSLVHPCLDFQLLNGTPAFEGRDAEKTQEVLLVAAPQARRDDVLEELERAGIQPEVLDAQPLPALNAVLAAYPPESGAGWHILLELGARSSVLAAVLADGSFYSRPLDFTGDALTRILKAELELDQAAAERVKRELREFERGAPVGLLDSPLEILVREIRETLRFLTVRRRNLEPGRIFLSGGSGLLPGLRDTLADALGVEVVYPDPFQGVLAEPGSRPGPAESPWLIGALGLARWWE
jgi:type IV pilus assembly protein PilM